MNRYKILKYSIEPKIVGIKDGTRQGFLDEDFQQRNPGFTSTFYHNSNWTVDWWKKWVSWKTYGQDLEGIKLEKTAKLTDIIGVSSLYRGLIVNNKVRNILSNFNLPDHHYFDVTLVRKGEVIQGYYWLCFDVETGEHTVDFEKCNFHFRYPTNTGLPENTQIRSYEEYINLYYKIGSAITVTDLALNNNFNIGLDLWDTQFLTCEKYISERLIDVFEKNNIMGPDYINDIYDLTYDGSPDLFTR